MRRLWFRLRMIPFNYRLFREYQNGRLQSVWKACLVGWRRVRVHPDYFV